MKPLLGLVASMPSSPTPHEDAEPPEDAAVLAAAVAYVTALKAWEARTSYNETRRAAWRRSHRELVAAVEAWMEREVSDG